MAKHKRYEQTRKDKSRNHWAQRINNAPRWYCKVYKRWWKTSNKKYIREFMMGNDDPSILLYNHKHMAKYDWY